MQSKIIKKKFFFLHLLTSSYNFPSFIYLFIYPHRVACRILVPRSGIEPVPPALEPRILNHWMARKVPLLFLNVVNLSCLRCTVLLDLWLNYFASFRKCLAISISNTYTYVYIFALSSLFSFWDSKHTIDLFFFLQCPIFLQCSFLSLSSPSSPHFILLFLLLLYFS